MHDGLAFGLVLASALGCALMAGFFFAFSAAVMTALGRLPDGQGPAAMRSINLAVINPAFLAVFVGTGLVALAAAVVAIARWGEAGAAAAVIGSAAYLVGSWGVTGAANVPMNNALAASDPGTSADAALWSRYLVRWTAFNHVRTVASLVACAAFILALAGE
jgi:uncharacterized membrane protein